MKSIATYLCVALLTPGLFISPATAQRVTAASVEAIADNGVSPAQMTLEDLLVRAERDPTMYLRARQSATDLELPISVLLPSNILMFPAAVEENKPLYAIIANIAHPFEGGDVQFFEEITRRYDLSGAKMTFAQTSRTPSSQVRPRAVTNALLVPDWTADRVWAFDPVTGDVVDTAFIHSNSTALASPKQALEHPVHRFITVSDQITDLVQKFDPEDGMWLGWFAPSGGVNNGILDNIRGHAYRPNNNLLVTVASGSNSNTIAEFDTGGNYIGNFIAAGSGGLNGPFDIMFRENDILISQSSSPAGVKQYDLNGTYIGQWASITSFPQQIFRMADGRIAVANFSGTGNTGIRLYDANGNFLRLLSGVTGNRGVYQIPNGNFLTTNSAGIHEIDSTTGNLVRTIQVGTNFQYINLYSPASEPPTTFFDDFETYTAGVQLVVQNPTDWKTWSGPAGTGEDPFVSNAQAFSGTKSVVIVQNNDLVRTHGSLTTGTHVMTFKFYIPSGKAGYFNTLAGFTPNPFNWGMEAYFDSAASGNNGRLFAGQAAAIPFSYAHNTWQTVRVVVNLGIDSARFILNGTEIRKWRWTAGSSGGGSPLRLDANDLFGATAWDQMYVDDYAFDPDTIWTGINEELAQIPETFGLEQNYPNPFNPTTTIGYSLPASASVKLSIYNMLGQKIAEPVSETQTAGYYRVKWDGRNLVGSQVSSGVYLYRLEARPTDGSSPVTNIKKMLLLK